MPRRSSSLAALAHGLRLVYFKSLRIRDLLLTNLLVAKAGRARFEHTVGASSSLRFKSRSRFATREFARGKSGPGAI
ncbi:hypothetical protein OB919_07980 [Halobacteria archaeon AArc-curdl1]|uniref:Uncharacterized protein n=1 Tax=Natronosalvus hydrolyticus TaxID=2979988 RepID=A0AAP2Z8D1_9EURY|nr:hypothetical protein [Halobacteria archaeon AArc-curdl1]